MQRSLTPKPFICPSAPTLCLAVQGVCDPVGGHVATKDLEHNPRIAITVIRHPLITKAFYYTAHGMSREEKAAFVIVAGLKCAEEAR